MSLQFISAQEFTVDQYRKANTANEVSFLTIVEKEAIMYINLARLYPRLFAKVVLENYTGPEGFTALESNNTYFKSLQKKLARLDSMDALQFSADLYENAKCFSAETGNKGGVGHHRNFCPKLNFAECISYGMTTGKDIALQWLIDDRVPSLGHRKIVLDSAYHKIGLSIHAHKKWGTCAVAEIIW